MREIIKQPFANIESEWEKVKRAIQKDSKEVLGYAKRATPVEWLTAEKINLVEERRKLKSKQRGNPQTAKHHNYLCGDFKRKAKKDRESVYKVYVKRSKRLDSIIKHILSMKLSDG